MKKRIHPQDFALLLAGVYALLSPLWTDTSTRATWTMVALGGLATVLAAIEIIRPDLMSVEGLTALVGVALIASPWVVGFSDLRGMAWTAWAVGAVTLIIGAADLQVTRSHRGGAMANPH